ncbi:MAG TPA: F0F1 ATP synthase subunit A [Thermodesulfobacteriota bacterium]|nr:F0F1 ATP synthase subunit A [Deltaproteobacteria bacterium]HNR12280.1 F0F1 ATP synthase subunit A [Thermodesulfobacteriota bacterium]HNU70777.1 F0F1 ATP synthase subunit A [Thermodesulfobacteriota bacterium]HOC38388.1 F0F1 ATP synthase subunit A [Thermodesulfobacteriota bacterium]
MELNPDSRIWWEWGVLKINDTIAYTWIVMALLVLFSALVTRNISTEMRLSRSQNVLETIISFLRSQIHDVIGQNPQPFLAFIGTLYLFIALANFLSFVPVYHPPTASLSTTAALAACVFCAVPLYGIKNKGFFGYLKHYTQPTFFMLPFHVIGELSRTLALAVRLFGNVLSGTVVAAILLSIAPLLFPVLMQLLELLIGQVQAYIFTILAAVYIGSASRVQEKQHAE